MESQEMEKAESFDRTDGGKDRSKESTLPRVRRRNRMITSCLECRRRKLKCDKQQPCTNCIKFSRDCVFLAPALDSLSQKKLNEIKERMGTLERTLEEDVIRRNAHAMKHDRRGSAGDLPGEGSDSDDGPIPEDEKGLEATPLATVDATYEDTTDINDDVLDLGFRVGKFRMTERLGGLFRPKLAEEMVFTLVREDKRGTEPEAPLNDDNNTFLEPGPAFVAPGSGFLFGDAGTRKSLVDFLPTKAASDLLLRRYHDNCHTITKVVHWPSFLNQYNTFWNSVLAGIEPPPSLQAIIFAASFSAVASMSYSEVDSVFHQSFHQVLTNFQQATEVSLGNAHVLRTTKFETLQALIIYLIPMCRGEISRAHSVLVGAAIRLGECFSLHRDPIDTFGHVPIEAQVRRLAWFQLCFLDFRTAEAHGPRPSIKREDYDTKMPWSLNDDELSPLTGSQSHTFELREMDGVWTDTTLSRIRFECCEMHRIVWHDRIRLDKQKVSITHCLSKIEAFRTAMEKKYAWLNISVTIQHYARILLDVLLFRMHIMILHKFHTATSTRIPDRLRQLVISSGTKLSESAVRLDIDPKFECFKWYSTALQQWHTAFLLLIEVFVYPNRREADRIWSIADHVFEPNLALTRVQKARSILGAVRDRAASYRNVRKLREPVSMQNRLNTNLPTRARIRGPEMITPLKLTKHTSLDETQITYHEDSSTFIRSQAESFNISNVPTTTIKASGPIGGLMGENSMENSSASSWSFDSPQTLFMRGQESTRSVRPDIIKSHPNEPSPSNSSHLTEQWPPNILSAPQATYKYTQDTNSPPQDQLNSSDYSYSPPAIGTYGNTAIGLVSGQFIPQQNMSVTPATNTMSYDSPSPSFSGPLSPETQPAGPSAHYAVNIDFMGPRIPAPNGGAAWGPTQIQVEELPNPQGMPMMDIDWNEWDKLFPIEMNNGVLDMPQNIQ